MYFSAVGNWKPRGSEEPSGAWFGAGKELLPHEEHTPVVCVQNTLKTDEKGGASVGANRTGYKSGIGSEVWWNDSTHAHANE